MCVLGLDHDPNVIIKFTLFSHFSNLEINLAFAVYLVPSQHRQQQNM